jgi:hypothetical protein
MKRSFRVATVFTGAAALTGAFAPAAVAAPASFHQQACGEDANYVHLYYPAGADHGPVCFGGVGGVSWEGNSRPSLYGICGGNNSGTVVGQSTGRPEALFFKIHFGHGNYSRPFHDWNVDNIQIEGNLRLTMLSISKWSGNTKCPS